MIVKNSSYNHSSIIENAHSVLRKLVIIFNTMSKIDNQNKTKVFRFKVLFWCDLKIKIVFWNLKVFIISNKLFVTKFLNFWHSLNFFWKIWIEIIDIINIKSSRWRMKLLICFLLKNLFRNFWKTIEKFFQWIVYINIK